MNWFESEAEQMLLHIWLSNWRLDTILPWRSWSSASNFCFCFQWEIFLLARLFLTKTCDCALLFRSSLTLDQKLPWRVSSQNKCLSTCPNQNFSFPTVCGNNLSPGEIFIKFLHSVVQPSTPSIFLQLKHLAILPACKQKHGLQKAKCPNLKTNSIYFPQKKRGNSCFYNPSRSSCTCS